MAQPHESQPVAIELMPTAREAPPPYEHVSLPLPTYHRDSGDHGDENHASPPSYQTLLQRARRQSANPVEKLYHRVNSTNAVKWAAAMVCLGTSVAVLLKFPTSSLRPFLLYLIAVVRQLCRPFLPQTHRPISLGLTPDTHRPASTSSATRCPSGLSRPRRPARRCGTSLLSGPRLPCGSLAL